MHVTIMVINATLELTLRLLFKFYMATAINSSLFQGKTKLYELQVVESAKTGKLVENLE